jgi:hypothetical protein
VAFSVPVLHSLAAAAAEMGSSELTIGGLIGHSEPSVTGLRTYPRFALLAAAERVSARIAAVLNGESRAEVVELHNRVETAIQA